MNMRYLVSIALGFTALATGLFVSPSIAGRGAHRAELAGVVKNGGVDAIVAKLEKAENMPATPETIGLIEALLAHDEYRVREAASWWFARRPHHKERLTSHARVALAAGGSLAVRNAADMVGTFGTPRVVSALAAAAERGDIDALARAAVVSALGVIGHPAANPTLSTAVLDSDAEVRLAAITAWAAIRRQDGAGPVAELLDDPDVRVRRTAARIVGMFPGYRARAPLEAMLTADADPIVRRNAAFSLGRIGDVASRAVLSVAAEGDSSSLVRGYAAAALRAVGR